MPFKGVILLSACLCLWLTMPCSADRLANRKAPQIIFRSISVGRSSKHILRSARGMYIFKCVRKDLADSRDHLDELQAEAEAYRHRNAVAPIRAGSLFPRFLGRFSHQAEPAAEGLLTSALGEPIEVFDLSFIHSRVCFALWPSAVAHTSRTSQSRPTRRSWRASRPRRGAR